MNSLEGISWARRWGRKRSLGLVGQSDRNWDEKIEEWRLGLGGRGGEERGLK